MVMSRKTTILPPWIPTLSLVIAVRITRKVMVTVGRTTIPSVTLTTMVTIMVIAVRLTMIVVIAVRLTTITSIVACLCPLYVIVPIYSSRIIF